MLDKVANSSPILFQNGSVSTLRSASSRFRNGAPAGGPAPVMKSASGNSLDDNERRTMERKIADLEIQLKVQFDDWGLVHSEC